MRTTTLTNLPRGLARIVLSLLTCTYIGAYRYHTRDPINKIHCCQNKTLKRELIEALVDFRRLKDEELAFVAKAVSRNYLNPGYGRLFYSIFIGCFICCGSYRSFLMACDREHNVGR